MKKKLNLVLCCIMIIQVAVVLSSCGSVRETSANSNGQLGSDVKNPYLKNSVEVNQSAEFNGYNFNLENVFYDKMTRSGYLYMTLTSDENDVSKLKVIQALGIKVSDGLETLFSIIPCYNREEYKYEYKDGKLNIYILFVDEQDLLNGTMKIVDLSTEEEKEFILPDSMCSEYYIGKDGKEVWISPISVYFNKTDSEDIKSLKLILKNGDSIQMVEQGRVCGKFTLGSGGDGNTFVWFNEYYDYKNIDYFEFNGEKFEKGE